MKHKNLLLSLAGLASIACLVYGAAPGRLSGSIVRQTAGNEFCPKSTAPTAANGKDTKKSRRAEQSDLPLLYGIAQAEGSDFALYSFQPTGDTEVTQIFSSPKLNASGAAVYVDGKIYSTQLLQQGMSGYYSMQYVFDMETHEIIE